MGSIQAIIMSDAKVRAIDSSTNATPIVVTDVGHDLETGDNVTIFGHLVNTAANGTWKVTRLTADTFSLDGSVGNGIGGGTGSWGELRSTGVFVEDAETLSIIVDTDGGADAAMTLKFWVSDQEDVPDPAQAQASDNQYDFVDVIDKEDGSSLDGDSGFIVATADDHRQFEANINSARWFGVLPFDGTEGEVTVKVRIHNKLMS